MDETRIKNAESVSHDLFECKDCLKEGARINLAVARIERWSEALTVIAPPAAISEGDPDPEEIRLPDDVNVFTLTEGLAHAIFYEVERLGADLPSRVLCQEERVRASRFQTPAPERSPKAVAR